MSPRIDWPVVGPSVLSKFSNLPKIAKKPGFPGFFGQKAPKNSPKNTEKPQKSAVFDELAYQKQKHRPKSDGVSNYT